MHFLLSALIYQFCIGAIFQDEAPYMKEWIDHHRSVGADHFWLYNNDSSDNYKEVLQPYIDEGVVELIEWPSPHRDENDWNNYCFNVQPAAYTDALYRARGKANWLALIDLDEFIVPVKEKSVPKILETHFPRHSRIGGVCVNWQCYGTSNVYKAPAGKMLDSLTHKARTDHPDNLYYKSIVRPQRTTNCTNPHLCNYLSPFFHVTTAREQVGLLSTSVRTDLLRINHYWTRDEWFLHEVKIPRYTKWGNDAGGVLNRAAQYNEVYDPILTSPK